MAETNKYSVLITRTEKLDIIVEAASAEEAERAAAEIYLDAGKRANYVESLDWQVDGVEKHEAGI